MGAAAAFEPLLPIGILAAGLFSWIFVRVPERLVYLLIALMPFHLMIRNLHPLLAYWKDGIALVLLSTALSTVYLEKIRGGGPSFGPVDPMSRVLFALLGAHVVWVAIAFAAMNDKGMGLFGLQQYLVWPLAFVAMTILLKSPAQFVFALRLWIVASLLVSGLAIYESAFLTGEGWSFSTSGGASNYEGSIRVFSTFDSMLSLGTFCALLLPLLVTQIAAASTFWGRALAALALFANSLALMLTISRGPLIQGCVGVAIAVVLTINWKRGRSRARFGALLLAALGAAALVVVTIRFVPDMGARVASVVDWRYDPGNLSRIESWSSSWTRIQQRPLFGHGLASTSPRALERSEALGVAESQFLQILVELGLVGFTLFAPVLLIIPLMGAAALRVVRDRRLFLLAAGATAATSAMLLEASVSQFMESSQVQVPYWFLAALVYFLYATRPRTPSVMDAQEREARREGA